MFTSNPVAVTPENLTQGKVLYERHCVDCHGNKGVGNGVIASKLHTPPADLTKLPAFPNGFLEWTIKNGGDTDLMPAWQGVLTQREVWLIGNYVRGFNQS